VSSGQEATYLFGPHDQPPVLPQLLQKFRADDVRASAIENSQWMAVVRAATLLAGNK